MIQVKPGEESISVQRPGEMHGQPLSVIKHNAGVTISILTLWILILVAALSWITWWGVRARRRQNQA